VSNHCASRAGAYLYERLLSQRGMLAVLAAGEDTPQA
jgi:hypothetical protein